MSRRGWYIAYIALCVIFLLPSVTGCVSSPPPQETKLIDAGRCWFEMQQCSPQQIGVTVFDGCETVWGARCREAELERYLRDGCSVSRWADPTKIAVTCGGAK